MSPLVTFSVAFETLNAQQGVRSTGLFGLAVHAYLAWYTVAFAAAEHFQRMDAVGFEHAALELQRTHFLCVDDDRIFVIFDAGYRYFQQLAQGLS